MDINTTKWLGICFSVAGVAIIIWNFVDFLAGWHKVPTMVGLIGLALGAIGINFNNQYLMNRKPIKKR